MTDRVPTAKGPAARFRCDACKSALDVRLEYSNWQFVVGVVMRCDEPCPGNLRFERWRATDP